MLQDSEDVLHFSFISGDALRQKSLEKLSQRYCREILIILFTCYEERNDYANCISFLSKVRERQPLVPNALTEEDYSMLLERQTSAVLKSQTVMYETLICNSQNEEPDKDIDTFLWVMNKLL